jgi:hypothetical protein
MRYSLFIFLSCALVACKPDSGDETVDVGYAYFPVQVGATWVYDVDSISYDDNTGSTVIDTISYQYKEEITGTFKDATGKTGQLVSRYFRDRDTMPWIRVANATLLLTELDAQKVQENIRFAKLVFPLGNEKKWNGNAYNQLGKEEYEITSFDATRSMGGKVYDKTLNVLQEDELNAVDEIRREEVYARNTGLIYLVSDSINTQISGSRGYRYRLTLKSFTP